MSSLLIFICLALYIFIVCIVLIFIYNATKYMNYDYEEDYYDNSAEDLDYLNKER